MIKREERPRELVVGEACWLLLGTSTFDVEIAEVRRVLEGDPLEFVMYRVSTKGVYKTLEAKSQHRSDLFSKADERGALLARVDADMNSLEYLRAEIEAEGEAADG